MSLAFIADGKLYSYSVNEIEIGKPLFNKIPFDKEIIEVFIQQDQTYTQEISDSRYIIDINGDSWVRGDTLDPWIGKSKEWTKIETETKFKMMAIGHRFFVAIDINNDLWLIGHPLSRSVDIHPKKIGIGTKFVDISAGKEFFLAVDVNGSIWMLGNMPEMNTFNDLTNITLGSFITVSCGTGHTLALDDDGIVWGLGLVSEGRLGFDDLNSSIDYITEFVQITKNCPVVAISAGYKHSLFLTNRGALFGCGNNDFGQSGERNVRKVGQYSQIVIGSSGEFKQIFAAGDSTLLTDAAGNLWKNTILNNIGFERLGVAIRDVKLPNRKISERNKYSHN